MDVYDDGQWVVGRDRAIGQNADRRCAKRTLDMDLVGGDIGRFGFGTAPVSLSASARRRVKDSAVSGSSGGHSASASRNSGSTSSIVLMDGSRVGLSYLYRVGSPERLPAVWMSASVHHSKDDDVVLVHPKINRVRKLAHNRAADLTMNQRKRQRVRHDALDRLFDCVREPSAKSRPLLFVPPPAPRGLLPRLVAERRPYGSRPVAKPPPHVLPGNRRPGVGKVLGPTAIELGSLLRPELKFGTTLLVCQTFPEGDRKFGAIDRW